MKRIVVSKRATLICSLAICAILAYAIGYGMYTDTYALSQSLSSGMLTLEHTLSLDGTQITSSNNAMFLEFNDIHNIEVDVKNVGTLDAREKTVLWLAFPAGTTADSIKGIYVYDGNTSDDDIKADLAEVEPSLGLPGELLSNTGNNVVFQFILPEYVDTIVRPFNPFPTPTDYHTLPVIVPQSIGLGELIYSTNSIDNTVDEDAQSIIPVDNSKIYTAKIAMAPTAGATAQGIRGNIYSAVGGLQAAHTTYSEIAMPTFSPGTFSAPTTTDITLDKSTITINGILVGAKLKPTIIPQNATNRTVTWTTSDASVATVDANGTVVSRGTGQATITAKNATGQTAICTVIVN